MRPLRIALAIAMLSLAVCAMGRSEPAVVAVCPLVVEYAAEAWSASFSHWDSRSACSMHWVRGHTGEVDGPTRSRSTETN